MGIVNEMCLSDMKEKPTDVVEGRIAALHLRRVDYEEVKNEASSVERGLSPDQ